MHLKNITYLIKMEEYRQIKDFENYEVSIFGNVKNVKTGRNLKNGIDGSGYCFVILYKNKKGTNKKIHRLVADTFLENPDNKDCIDHIDNNKLNNNIENLRFATYQENNRNIKIRKDNTSEVKGVCFDKSNNKWMAYLTLDSIFINLGRYKTLEEAKEARVKRANEAFGVFTNSCEKI